MAGYGSRVVPPDLVIGVDVGGTKMLAGVVARDGSVGRTIERPTSTTGQASLLEELDGLVEELLAAGAAAIGVGVPMNLDRRTGIGFGAVNLPLRSLDLAAHLRGRFSLPVGVENDGNAIALAEWRVGAGRGTNDLVALALGTGVGGGVVIDGRLFRGWAELGHVVVAADGPPCQGSCHGHGHLEAVASGTAADRAAQRLWGGDAGAEELVERARAGDDEARAALAEIGRLLGAAIGSFVNVFGPEVVVIGGGFGSGAGELLLGPALESARLEALPPTGETLRLVEAELGAEAGLVGAGLLALELVS